MKESEKIIDQIKHRAQTVPPDVSARFGKGWKKHARKHYNREQLIDMCFTQGRIVKMMEVVIEKLVD